MTSPVLICEAFTEEHRATRETCGVKKKKKSMSPRSVLDAIPPSKHRNSSVERETIAQVLQNILTSSKKTSMMNHQERLRFVNQLPISR